MSLTSYCRNCGQSKDLNSYADNYCPACTSAVREAREFAQKEGLDLGQATRTALAQRAHDIHSNRPNPFNPVNKADYWANGNRQGNEGVALLVVCIVIILFYPVVWMVADAIGW